MMFIVQYVIAKDWKLIWIAINRKLDKLWYVYNMENSVAVKK